jgi:hypothetical protein
MVIMLVVLRGRNEETVNHEPGQSKSAKYYILEESLSRAQYVPSACDLVLLTCISMTYRDPDQCCAGPEKAAFVLYSH